MRIGNRFDRLGGGMVRFAYLIGAVLGIFAFFSHLAVSAPELTWGFGAMIAGALVLHEYLQTRRVLLVGSRLLRGKGTPEERQAGVTQLKLNIGILGVLLAFNAFAMWNYLTQVTGGTAPIPTGIGNVLEALALPMFGLVASLLVEVTDDAGVVLQRAASDMLFQTTNMAVKQWRKRVQNAVQNGHNLAPIATDLMLDAGDTDGARRIGIIETGLANTERDKLNLYVSQSPVISGARAVLLDPISVPRSVPSKRGTDDRPKGSTEYPQKPVQIGRKTRRSVTLTAQQKVFAYMDKNPHCTLAEVVSRCKVSRSTAVEYRNRWKYERSFQGTGTEG